MSWRSILKKLLFCGSGERNIYSSLTIKKIIILKKIQNGNIDLKV